jgi:lipopolysaccharide transport system permease protein
MMSQMLGSLWRYRHFILSSIQSDFHSRVARSRLGLLWVVISPLSQVVIYAFILSSLMGARLPGVNSKFAYSIYLMAGFLPWLLFVEIVNRCLTIFMENANALKKIAFPRIALPFIACGAAVLNSLIFFVLVMIAYILLGHNPGIQVLWFPLLLAITTAGSLGIGLILGILNIFIRDVGQMVAIFLQFGFWLTPVVYVIDILPPHVRDVIKLNPMFWMVDDFHRILVFGEPPGMTSLIGMTVLSLVLLAGAFLLFRKANSEMVDVL